MIRPLFSKPICTIPSITVNRGISLEVWGISQLASKNFHQLGGIKKISISQLAFVRGSNQIGIKKPQKIRERRESKFRREIFYILEVWERENRVTHASLFWVLG